MISQAKITVKPLQQTLKNIFDVFLRSFVEKYPKMQQADTDPTNMQKIMVAATGTSHILFKNFDKGIPIKYITGTKANGNIDSAILGLLALK